jgi:hypothetical protein
VVLPAAALTNSGSALRLPVLAAGRNSRWHCRARCDGQSPPASSWQTMAGRGVHNQLLTKVAVMSWGRVELHQHVGAAAPLMALRLPTTVLFTTLPTG